MGQYKNPIPSLDDEVDELDNQDESSKNKVSETEQAIGYKHLERVYFAFIDVLGFKKTFDDNQINSRSHNIGKYSDVFDYYFKLMNAANLMNIGNEPAYAGQTSDSLYFYTQRTDHLVEFIKIYSHFSLYAMTNDVFFRGGIAKGDLFLNEAHRFYGNSVIKAYLLESTISKFPIIAVDESTHKDIVRNCKEDERLFDEKDGRHNLKPFIYFDKQQLAIDPKFETKEISKKAILTKIELNQRRFEFDANNYTKYIFLQDKYKEFMNKSKILNI